MNRRVECEGVGKDQFAKDSTKRIPSPAMRHEISIIKNLHQAQAHPSSAVHRLRNGCSRVIMVAMAAENSIWVGAVGQFGAGGYRL